MVWYSFLRAFHSLSWSTQSKAFSIVDETEIHVFLKFPCFFHNPVNVGNLMSSSSSFSKPNLDIWKFLVRIMLKPSMQDFSMTLLTWEMSAIVWWLAHSLVLPFLRTEMRIDLFQSCGCCWVFQICCHNAFKTLMASSFRDLNSSAGISSHPLGLLTAALLKVHLTLHSRMSGSGLLTTPS